MTREQRLRELRDVLQQFSISNPRLSIGLNYDDVCAVLRDVEGDVVSVDEGEFFTVGVMVGVELCKRRIRGEK